jgi:bacteriorhodopsin
MIGGTNKEWSLIITSFWELIGVAGGGILGVVLSFIISQPISRKWKWIIIGIIAALIALFLLFTNTTYFR